MATFPEIMYSQPSFLQSSTMATLMSSAKTLASGWSLYQSVSNLKQSWGGSSQLAQAGQATTLMSSGQQVLTSITQTQTQLSSAATQMQAAKVKLTTLVTAARAEGFIVLPTGQVIPSPPQLNPYTAAYYKARAVVYNAQISAVVATTTASDLQNGLALAKTGVDILSAIMNRNGSAPAPAVTGVDPTTLTGANIGAPTLPADQIGVGTGLAGVGGLGDLHGIMSDGGLGGLNSLPGGGIGSGLGPGGTGPGGLGAGLGGAGGAGVGNLGGALVAGQGIGAGSRLGGGPGLFGGGPGGAGARGRLGNGRRGYRRRTGRWARTGRRRRWCRGRHLDDRHGRAGRPGRRGLGRRAGGPRLAAGRG